MNTAVQSNATSLLEQIDAHRLEAEQFGAEAQDLFSQYQAKLVERNQALTKLAEAATQIASEELSMPTNGHVAKPAAVRAVAKPAPAKGKAVAAKPAKAKPAPVAGAGGRLYGQEVGLKQTIWNVLNRSNATNRKFCTEVPTSAVGLKIGEINTIIKTEGAWKSSADNITSQVQQHLYALRDKGLIVRDEETRRYSVVEGAVYA